jgi:hypothetical protein
MSPSNTFVAGKFLWIKEALEGSNSQAAITGILLPHSIPTSPNPPPEKREPARRILFSIFFWTAQGSVLPIQKEIVTFKSKDSQNID